MPKLGPQPRRTIYNFGRRHLQLKGVQKNDYVPFGLFSKSDFEIVFLPNFMIRKR